jgi:hypothetical protein
LDKDVAHIMSSYSDLRFQFKIVSLAMPFSVLLYHEFQSTIFQAAELDDGRQSLKP